ncbi:GFA family protein [Methylobacterium oryzisoli]|uniref:GFA family protein n=1 Tax=Methylobacterium oryzisoli TaxID=3385502 RepID=UPI003891C106
MARTFQGGCLCGASRYEARGEPINVRVCHCRLCQRAIGAAFNARVLMPIDAVTISGPVGRFNSSPALARGFCQICGTALFSERTGGGVVGLTCGSLDEPAAFRPTAHMWTASKQAWVPPPHGCLRHPVSGRSPRQG